MIQIEIKKSDKLNGDESAFLSFPYDNELVGIIRNQSTRHWHADSKVWEIPSSKLGILVQQFGNRPITITGQFNGQEEKAEVDLPEGFTFKTEPFRHQVEGFKYGLQHDRFLLGDEQGLGKTKQVIDIAVAKKLQKGYTHCLIINGVNGLKWNWQDEIAVHSNEKSMVLGTRMKGKTLVEPTTKTKLEDLNNLPDDVYFIITNIESIRDTAIQTQIMEMCKNGLIQMVAVDEIHKCKNPSSQQGKALLKILPECRIAMTGTPLMNSPMDLFVILKWLGFEKHSFFQFKKHYCVMGGYGGYEVVGYRNLPELQEALEQNMLRRLKKETLNLPPKIHNVDYVEMTKDQRKIYIEVLEAIKEDVDRILLSPNPLAQLIRLRQATGHPGILTSKPIPNAKMDRLEDLMEEIASNGEKCVIFSNWVEVVNEAVRRLQVYNPAVITGEVEDPQAEKNRFMTDPRCSCIIGTIGKMGTGYTLTAGTHVIFLDSPWNGANKDQAEDRTHRIGTTGTINVTTLVCKDTIDERIEDIVEQKVALSKLLVDGQPVSGKASVIIDFLLN